MVDPRITYTPNLKLTKLPENFHVWAEIMNNNLTMVDAAVSGFVVYNNLRGAWANSTAYIVGDSVMDAPTAVVWQCLVTNTSSSIPRTFTEERALHPTYWGVYSAPAKARGVWTGPGTAYALNDFVVADGTKYAVCIGANVSSSSFNADVISGYWSILVDLSAAGSLVLPNLAGPPDANKLVITNPAGNSYTIQTVMSSLVAGGMSTIGQLLLTASSQASARGTINAVDASGSTAFGLSLLTLPDASSFQSLAGGVPTGALMPFAGTSVPTGWLFCGGQTVLRATYGNLFTAIGTTYNTGGELGTEFRLPDMGGRVPAGKEVTPTRLTVAGSGINGSILGAAGGAQSENASVTVGSVSVSVSGGISGSTSGAQSVNINSGGPSAPNIGSANGPQGTSTDGHSHAVSGSTGGEALSVGGSFSGSGSGTGSGTTAVVTNAQPTIVLNYIIKT